MFLSQSPSFITIFYLPCLAVVLRQLCLVLYNCEPSDVMGMYLLKTSSASFVLPLSNTPPHRGSHAHPANTLSPEKIRFLTHRLSDLECVLPVIPLFVKPVSEVPSRYLILLVTQTIPLKTSRLRNPSHCHNTCAVFFHPLLSSKISNPGLVGPAIALSQPP